MMALKVSPVLEITFAVRLSVEEPGAAAELPDRIIVQTTAPAEFTVGKLKVAVKPLGSPETTLMVDPVAPAGKTTPPAGVAVTVTVVVAAAAMVIVTGDVVY
jgi:hypothetical protein